MDIDKVRWKICVSCLLCYPTADSYIRKLYLRLMSNFHSRPLLIMNRQQIITKVKNPPGNLYFYIIRIFSCLLLVWDVLRACLFFGGLFLMNAIFSFYIFVLWLTETFLDFRLQFSKQVPSQSSDLRSSAGAVPKSDWDLWTGEITPTSLYLKMLSVALGCVVTEQTNYTFEI